MKITAIVCVLSLTLVGISLAAPSQAKFDFGILTGPLISALTGQIINLVAPLVTSQNSNVQLLDMSCTSSLKSRISSFELVWDAKFWCPSLSGDKGSSSAKSRDGAIRGAIQSYFEKNFHLLSEAQLTQLINGK